MKFTSFLKISSHFKEIYLEGFQIYIKVDIFNSITDNYKDTTLQFTIELRD